MKKQIVFLLVLSMMLVWMVPVSADSGQTVYPQVLLSSYRNRPGNSGNTTSSFNSAVITAGGDLYVWGGNSYGQCGVKDTTYVKSPNLVLSDVKKAIIGQFCAAITNDGTLYTWGRNDRYQLGHGSSNQSRPRLIMKNVADVAIGSSHTVALMNDGTVYGWGNNSFGQLATDKADFFIDPIVLKENMKAVYAYENTTFLVGKNGGLYCCGENYSGQLGVMDTNAQFQWRYPSTRKVQQLQNNTMNTAFLTDSGELYNMGNNTYGQVSYRSASSTSVIYNPVQITSDVKSFSMEYYTLGYIKNNGDLYMMGYNYTGKCGIGQTSRVCKSTKIMENVAMVSVGKDHTVFVTQNGDLYAMGDNTYGQLGIGGIEAQLSPVKVMSGIRSAEAERNCTAAVGLDGSVYFWGENYNYEVGNGQRARQETPFRHDSLSGLVKPEQWQCPFSDVNTDAFYYDAVRWAVENGITNGISATQFAPDRPCTRGQVVTFLWRSMGSPAPKNTNNPFTDTDESAYYHKAMLWAVEQGITNGTSATTFSPDAPCTRAQVATFLHRTAGTPAYEAINQFGDVHSGTFYYDAVLWAVEQGITNGMSPGVFAPDRECTRAQIVTFLHRYAK